MTDKDIIDMINRCIEEIKMLRGRIVSLEPKAHAYESVTKILDLLPKPSQGHGEDLLWRLEKQVQELRAVPIEGKPQ